MTKATVNIKTVRQWVKEALTRPSNETTNEAIKSVKGGSMGTPDSSSRDDEVDIKKRSLRRMKDYRDDGESRPAPRSSVSDIGHDNAPEMEKIRQHRDAPKIKIFPASDSDEGTKTFAVPGDEGYEDIKAREWTDEELPVRSTGSSKGSVSGIALDIKTSMDKLALAEAVPEFVIQMLVRAARDYKKLMHDPLTIIKMAVRDYVKDIKGSGELDDEELSSVESERGMAMLVDSSGFREFFGDWAKGTRKLEDGTEVQGASPKVAKLLALSIPRDRMLSAVRMVKQLKTLDVDNEEPSAVNLAKELDLETNYEPEITKTEAFFILHDPFFRYFVNGQGGGQGSRVYYWDWVRNNAQKAGEYGPKKNKWMQF